MKKKWEVQHGNCNHHYCRPVCDNRSGSSGYGNKNHLQKTKGNSNGIHTVIQYP
ncbi:MAG: hypothetical protein IIW99_08995 [Treponema sp.]|nr:hypothetical protein [Treponema sp.]